MSVNANVNADEYTVTLFNRYAQQVPVDLYNRLWEQQSAGTNVFGDMPNGQLPDWAVMVTTPPIQLVKTVFSLYHGK